jgi:hypothetical protein
MFKIKFCFVCDLVRRLRNENISILGYESLTLAGYDFPQAREGLPSSQAALGTH